MKKTMASKNGYYDYDDYEVIDDEIMIDDGYNDHIEREIEREIDFQETINSFKSIFVNY